MKDKYCLYCNKLIPNNGSRQYSSIKYCCRSCCQMSSRKRKKATTSTREQQRMSNLSVNNEWLYIARECARAGTVQILSFLDLESLHQLTELLRDKPKAKSEINICHIAPVKGDGIIGCLHPSNCFYGGSLQNKAFGNKHAPGAGLYIKKNELKSKWRVNNSMTDREVLNVVERFLGDTLKEYVKHHPVRKSARIRLIDNIIGLDVCGEFTRNDLNKMRGYELAEIEAGLRGKTVNRYIPKNKYGSKIFVYISELSRMAKASEGEYAKNCLSMRDALVIGSIALEKCSWYPDYSYYTEEHEIYFGVRMNEESQWSKFKDFLYFQAFSCLQGFPVDNYMVFGTLAKYTNIKDTVNARRWRRLIQA